MIAFPESEDYGSAIRNAVSSGEATDSPACIVGSIAQAFRSRSFPKRIQPLFSLETA